ncbi:MAG TPA: serine protease [Phycisphaerae bacterium]|nr:serine protease [Phycisphaerae bacterium]
MKPILTAALLAAAAVAGCAAAPEGVSPAGDPSAVVDDPARMRQIEQAARELIDAGKATPSATLRKQLDRGQCALALRPARRGPLSPEQAYARCRRGVLMMSSVYKCTKCTKWHTSMAGAFVLTADGACVTNYHVVDHPDRQAIVATTWDGRTFPVKEVLAADKDADVAVVQLDAPGESFEPLALAPDAPVGSPVCLISHPAGRCYSLSVGHVSRYFRHRGKAGGTTTRMAVTADFARGSSGCPVLDARGNVAGMVASTSSIYYRVVDGKKEDLQMVVKQCVPAAAILRLVQEPGRGAPVTASLPAARPCREMLPTPPVARG